MEQYGGERRYGGHEAAQRAPARPMRGAVALPPAPPKVYRVEPRDFRELVQRLTGAHTASTTTTGPAMAAPAHAAAAQGGCRGGAVRLLLVVLRAAAQPRVHAGRHGRAPPWCFAVVAS
jgi:hypothetical protein